MFARPASLIGLLARPSPLNLESLVRRASHVSVTLQLSSISHPRRFGRDARWLRNREILAVSPNQDFSFRSAGHSPLSAARLLGLKRLVRRFTCELRFVELQSFKARIDHQPVAA